MDDKDMTRVQVVGVAACIGGAVVVAYGEPHSADADSRGEDLSSDGSFSLSLTSPFSFSFSHCLTVWLSQFVE